MTSDIQVIASTISALSVIFDKAAKRGGSIEIDAESVQNIASLVRTVERAFTNVAQELEVLRLTEASRMGRVTVEQLASDHLVDLMTDPTGKVVRPDFGRRT